MSRMFKKVLYKVALKKNYLFTCKYMNRVQLIYTHAHEKRNNIYLFNGNFYPSMFSVVIDFSFMSV